jgi:hypothetical protein
LAQYGGHHVDSDAKKVELYCKGLNIQLQDRLIQNLNISYNDLASTAIDQEGTMKACEVAEEKKMKRAMPGPTEVVLPVLHQTATWSTRHIRDSRADLHSSGATASSFSNSNSSPATLLSLHSSRGQLGHHNMSHQWGTRATTVGRLGTSPRNAACQGKPTHHVLQHLWLTSKRANREA